MSTITLISEYKRLAQNIELKANLRQGLPIYQTGLCPIHVHQAFHSGDGDFLPLLPSFLENALLPVDLKMLVET